MPQAFKKRFEGKSGKIMCRFFAVGNNIELSLFTLVPPIILGAALGNLEKIFGFCALFAFFLEFVFPGALQIASVRLCRKWWGKNSEKTPYSSIFSHFAFVIITLIFATFAFIFAFVAFVAPNAIKKLFS